MQSSFDDIIVKRNIITSKPKNKPKSEKNLESDANSLEASLNKNFNRNIKILSLSLFVLAFLIFLSLMSYSPKDEVFTELQFSDLIKLLKGDESSILSTMTTHNLLGILGAIISNILINYTIGFGAIAIPVIIVLIAISLFKYKRVTWYFIQKIILLALMAITFAALMGILTKTPLFQDLSKEWAGSIGFFIASVLFGLTGLVGTTIILICLFLLQFIFLTDLRISKIRQIYETLSNFFKSVFNFINEKTQYLKAKFNSKDNIKNDLIESGEEAEHDVEPARIIVNAISETDNSDDIPIPEIVKRFSLNKTQSLEPEIKIKRFKEQSQLHNDDKIIGDLNNKDSRSQNTNISDLSGSKSDKPADADLSADKYPDNNEYSVLEETKEPTTGKKLVITLNEFEKEAELTSPLSVAIYDEEIDYKPPTFDLLINDNDEYQIDENELKQNAKILQEKLETFKIFIENLSVTPGPVVTQYEFVPAAGIKISKIESLVDDIALALKAQGIRIIAPIPGKGTVGIEIPNKNPAIVRFSSIVKSSRYHNSNFRLPLALGKTISGEVFCTDLSRMPHLLMAGATGSGKSVGINTIIASLLFKIHPKNLKFVIIDPKKVELKQYEMLENHFLAVSPDLDKAIITDPQDAVIALKAVCAEMDLRYEILASVGQRNIYDYNKKVKDGSLKNHEEYLHKPMPYIIVVIDELADLMLTASKEVEAPIIRLAQLARAVGIHLVVATQRPSVDVITGIIKANFPSRIAYLVASRVDSRTIFDVMGAEQLLGNGDMLFQTGGSPHPIRIQNSYLTTEEIENICEFIGNQKGYSQPYLLPALNDNTASGRTIAKEDRDPLFEEAARLVIRHQQGSVSLIQRRLKVGYARAGRIIDELEAAGVVGSFDGSKARAVLMESESELEAIL